LSYDRLGLLAGLPVQAGLAILADLIADGVRPMPAEERARVLAIITREALELADMPAGEERPQGGTSGTTSRTGSLGSL
jgi:hypothetical protein